MHKKTLTIATVACVGVLLSGCQQEESKTSSASQQSEKAQSAVEKIVTAPDRAEKKIGDAVDMQNAKNEEAKKILEDGKPHKKENNKSMNKKTGAMDKPIEDIIIESVTLKK